MHRGEEVFADKALIEHNSILIVVPLPRHVSNLDVATKSKLTSLRGVPFGEDIPSLDTLTLETDGAQVDRGALVCLAELGEVVGRDGILEANEDLILGTIIADLNAGRIDEDNFTGTLSHDLRTRVTHQLALNTRTYDRSFGAKEGNSLTHHVRSHEGTVSVIML